MVSGGRALGDCAGRGSAHAPIDLTWRFASFINAPRDHDISLLVVGGMFRRVNSSAPTTEPRRVRRFRIGASHVAKLLVAVGRAPDRFQAMPTRGCRFISREQAERLGCIAYLRKPCEAETILALLRRLAHDEPSSKS